MATTPVTRVAAPPPRSICLSPHSLPRFPARALFLRALTLSLGTHNAHQTALSFCRSRALARLRARALTLSLSFSLSTHTGTHKTLYTHTHTHTHTNTHKNPQSRSPAPALEYVPAVQEAHVADELAPVAVPC